MSGLLSAFIIALVASCQREISGVRWAGVVTMFGTVIICIAMGLFHGVHSLEQDDIQMAEFRAWWKAQTIHRLELT